MRDALRAHDDLHTADGAHACARVGVDSDHMARQGRRYGTYAMVAGMLQGLQALSLRQWPPLGAFIKLPALRVVHDFLVDFDKTLAYLSIAFPEPFRGLIRTTNLLERFHKEIRRKQRDIGMFQSEQGCETLWYLLSRRETAKQRAILQSRS